MSVFSPAATIAAARHLLVIQAQFFGKGRQRHCVVVWSACFSSLTGKIR
jgi:hypothetical protein